MTNVYTVETSKRKRTESEKYTNMNNDCLESKVYKTKMSTGELTKIATTGTTSNYFGDAQINLGKPILTPTTSASGSTASSSSGSTAGSSSANSSSGGTYTNTKTTANLSRKQTKELAKTLQDAKTASLADEKMVLTNSQSLYLFSNQGKTDLIGGLRVSTNYNNLIIGQSDPISVEYSNETSTSKFDQSGSVVIHSKGNAIPSNSVHDTTGLMVYHGMRIFDNSHQSDSSGFSFTKLNKKKELSYVSDDSSNTYFKSVADNIAIHSDNLTKISNSNHSLSMDSSGIVIDSNDDVLFKTNVQVKKDIIIGDKSLTHFRLTVKDTALQINKHDSTGALIGSVLNRSENEAVTKSKEIQLLSTKFAKMVCGMSGEHSIQVDTSGINIKAENIYLNKKTTFKQNDIVIDKNLTVNNDLIIGNSNTTHFKFSSHTDSGGNTTLRINKYDSNGTNLGNVLEIGGNETDGTFLNLPT